jgi:hypothetical protein
VVRDPSRKPEQATCRAVCSRGQRAQRNRGESTTCIERRLRDGRRWQHRIRIPSPQRQWFRRLLAESSSGGQVRSGRWSRDLRIRLHTECDHRKSRRQQRNGEEMEERKSTSFSDCVKRGSIVGLLLVLYGFTGCKIYLASSRFRNSQRDGVRWTTTDTSGLRHVSFLRCWIIGLDLVFAHTSFKTLIASLGSSIPFTIHGLGNC